MKDTQVTLTDEQGNDVMFNIIENFYNEEFNKYYVLMTPEGTVNDEEEEIYPYSYTLNEDGSIKELFPIESDDEWDMIEDALDELFGDDEEDEL